MTSGKGPETTMYKHSLSSLLIAMILCGGGAARADRGVSSTAALPSHDRGGAIVGLKVGGWFPQAFSYLGSSYFVELEAGYMLPYLRRLLSLTASVSLSDPGLEGGASDPRVSGGAYTYSAHQLQLQFGLTAWARVSLGRVVPYVGLGPRLWLVRTASTGQAAAASFLDTSETSSEIGLAVPLGLELILGPGRAFVEGQLHYAPTAQRSSGESSLGAVLLGVGYRLVL